MREKKKILKSSQFAVVVCLMRFIFFFSFVFTDGALNMGKDIAGSLDRFDLAHVSNARISRFFKLIHIFLFFSPQRIMHVQIHISFVTIKH